MTRRPEWTPLLWILSHPHPAHLPCRWKILNPASMKQALVEGAIRLPGLNLYEQVRLGADPGLPWGCTRAGTCANAPWPSVQVCQRAARSSPHLNGLPRRPRRARRAPAS